MLAPQFRSLSQRSVGPCRGESRPDPDGWQPVAGQGAPRRSFARALWQRLRAVNDYLNDSWTGDLIGIAALAVIVIWTPLGLEILSILIGGAR